MRPETLLMNHSYELNRENHNENSFGESGSEQSGCSEVQQLNAKKKRTLQHFASSTDLKGHVKHSLPAIQQKKRSSSNEKPENGPTLDKLFGSNFKVIDVFHKVRESSEEHFPEDPLTRRLSPRKQNNFDIAETDEEEEDVKDIIRETSDKINKRLTHNASVTELKRGLPSASHPKFVKANTMVHLDRGRTPSEEREIAVRASRIRYHPRQNEDLTISHQQVAPTEHLILHVANLSGSSGFFPKAKKDPIKSYLKPQSTFYQQNNSLNGRKESKVSDPHAFPPLNLVIDTTNIEQKRQMKKHFFKTQAQFTNSLIESRHSPVPQHPLEFLERKRRDKENKFLSQKARVDTVLRDDGMHLIEKYADRFQLNVDEFTSKKPKPIKNADKLGLGIAGSRISTPYKSFQADQKTNGSISVRGQPVVKKPRHLLG